MTEPEEFEFRLRLEKEKGARAPMRMDPTEGMSDWEKATAGAGASIVRVGRGIGQLVGLSTREDEDEARRLEAPLMASGSSEIPPIQSGRMGIHPAQRPNRTTAGPAGAGATVGALVPLAAISTLLPGSGTVLGSAAIGAGTGAVQAVGSDESRMQNVSLGALAGGGSAAALKGAGAVMSKMLSKSQAEAAGEASRNAVRDGTLKAAQAEGYVIPPSQAGAGSMSKALESVGGKAATSQEAAIRNQEVTNSIARREAGLLPDQPITEASLEAARTKIAQPYREVEALASSSPLSKAPFKDPAKTLEELKEVRADANAYWKHYNASADPKSLAEAKKLGAKADLLEDSIEAVAKSLGKPDLVDSLRESRKLLAKNYDIERALNVGNGNVDAHVLGRMLDKKGEKAMSGGMLTIAKFAEAFGNVSREAGGIPTPGVSKLAPYGSIALGALGGAATQQASGTPYGMAAGALPLLSGPARSIALSKMMQPSMSYGPGAGMRLADLAANSQRLRMMAPAAAAASVANAEQ